MWYNIFVLFDVVLKIKTCLMRRPCPKFSWQTLSSLLCHYFYPGPPIVFEWRWSCFSQYRIQFALVDAELSLKRGAYNLSNPWRIYFLLFFYSFAMFFFAGSGRVTFNNHKSYMKAVCAGFIELKTPKFTKKVRKCLLCVWNKSFTL